MANNQRKLRIAKQLKEKNQDMMLEQNELEQKCIEVQKEIDELKKKETDAILAIEQKCSLKEMLLEREIEAMTELNEKAQIKLWAALTFGQGDKTAANNLKELCESKHATLRALKQRVSRHLKEYDELVKKVTATGTSVKKCLPKSDVIKCIRDTSDEKKLEDLMEQLKALCVSEDDGTEEETLGQKPAGAESRQ